MRGNSQVNYQAKAQTKIDNRMHKFKEKTELRHND
jgi:hypothetical protein